MAWIGDPDKRNSANPDRNELLKQRAELIKKITELKSKPLPRGDRQQMERFRKQDLTELAGKVLKIDKLLGRV